MIFVRRHLRCGVVAWLLCHALTFTALMPRDCCAAHGHAGAPAAGDHCDMTAHDGAACPMHRAGVPAAPCAMTGGCHAPEAALAAVLLQSAVLVPSAAPAPIFSAAVGPRPPDVSARSLTTPPDAPPPRA